MGAGGHVARGAPLDLGAELIPASNFGGEGPARVGEFGGVGPYGTYDMAGNVREWVWNVGGDHRWVLGGAWNDPVYMSSVRTDLPPFDRSPENGFRCVRYLGGEPLSDALADPVETQSPDYRAAQPASDEVFEAYTRQFSYFPTPLNATIESTDDSPTYWTRERVSFDAAYEDERVIAQLVLPKNGEPPYQVVVQFPGLGAFQYPENSDGIFVPDYVPRSGRALVQPVYKGSFDRWDGFLGLSGEEFLPTYRDRVVQWSQDLGRTLDYLEERDDLDATRVAFVGTSFGASEALPLLALESRLKTAVLICGGLPYRVVPEEVNPVHYLPRVSFPVLMVSGRYDRGGPHPLDRVS